MSGLRAAIERLEKAVADKTDVVEVIDASGLAPWTRENWPPWRHPEMHPIPAAWGGKAEEAGDAPDGA